MSLSVPPSYAPRTVEPPSPPTSDAPEPPVRHLAVWEVARRRAWLVLGAGALAALCAALVERTIDPVYESAASVRVDVKESHVPGVYQHVATGAEVGNELDLLHSRTLAEQIVDSLGLRVRLLAPSPARAGLVSAVRADQSADTGTFTFDPAPAGFVVSTGKPVRSVAVVKPGDSVTVAGATIVLAPAPAAARRIVVRVDGFQAAVTELVDALKVDRMSRESQVIAVRYQSLDPALARDVPNVAVANFLALRRRSQQFETGSTAAALRQQVRAVSAELARSDSTLLTFRRRQRVVDPHDEGTTQIARVAQLRTERTQIGTERDALAALMQSLAQRSRAGDGGELPYRQLVGFPTLMRNDAVWSYVRALTSVEEQRAALLVRRTPEDPDVIALTDRARTLEQQLRATATTYLDGLTQQTASVDAELQRAEASLARLPGQEAEFGRLERGPKVLGEMLTLLQTRLKEAEVAEAVADPTVQRLDVAPFPLHPVRPKPAQDVALAACAGLLLGLAGALVRDRLDRTVRTREDVRQWAGLPVVGVIPHTPYEPGRVPMRDRKALPTARPRALALLPRAGRRAYDERGLFLTEAIARLHATIAVWQPGGDLRRLVVTSPLSGEGKTTTASNLARAVARAGSRTLLIDGDLRRGTLHERFGIPRSPGFSDVLAGVASLDAVVHLVDVGDGAMLAVVPAGTPTDAARRILTAPRARAVLGHAGVHYDSVIVDASPINVTADAALLAAEADGVLLVARAGQTPLDALAHAVQQLGQTGATPLGVVVNDIDPVRDAAYDTEYRVYDDPYFHTSGAA